MADEKKKSTDAEVTAEVNENPDDKKVEAVTENTDKKAEKGKKEKDAVKKQRKFSFKKIGKSIAKWFKDLKGEIKKIVWPTRQMVIKSTGVVLASILVIGIGIWIVDYALSGAITAVDKAATATTTEATTAAASDSAEDESKKAEDTTAASTEASTTDVTESTSAAD